MNNIIYMDCAATAPIEKQVYNATLPYLYSEYGNPSSLYSLGDNAKTAIETARRSVADLVGGKPDEIIFTSGATESNNQILKTVAEDLKNLGVGNHIITTQIEHKSILNTCRYLERNGFRVTYLPVDKYGLISIKEFENAITDDTILASIMLVNNEIGTIEPIHAISDICRKKQVFLHTDATQALGKIPVNVNDLGVDYLSASAHKIGGLSGCGIIWHNSTTDKWLKTYIHGGLQEKGLRSGTENVIGIVSFGEAANYVLQNYLGNFSVTKYLRNWLFAKLLTIEGAHLNGPNLDNRSCNNINIRFDGVSSEALQAMLATKGICTSVGSACNNGDHSPSYVLKAIGLSDKECNESIRITLSHNNTMDECYKVYEEIKSCVEFLRSVV